MLDGQDSDVFIVCDELGTVNFCGEIFFPEGTTELIVVTPEADFIFTLTKTIPKELPED